MRRFFVFIAIMFTSLCANAQGVNSSVFGAQAGFLGTWANYETRLTNDFAMRCELGFDSGIWGGSYYDDVGFVLAPALTIEPRFYYDIRHRQAKNKNTDGNAASFISLKTSYHPDWFVVSNYSGVSVIADISIVPTWGIRRNLGPYFNYELGGGLGYRYTFGNDFRNEESSLALNLHLRIGYKFCSKK